MVNSQPCVCEDDLSVQLLKLLAPEKREPEAWQLFNH